MKQIILTVALIVMALHTANNNSFAQDVRIDNDKFLHTIVQKWIDEYKNSHPNSTLQVENSDAHNQPTIAAVAYADAHDYTESSIVYVGRYALIPVSNKNNPLIEKAGKGLKKKEVRNLVFEKDLDDDDLYDSKTPEKFVATVYSRGGQTSTTAALAEHFQQAPEKIRGKKIIGDEIFLIHAIKKDVSGVAFNTLNYVYDLDSRQLKDDLSILPLNLKTEHKNALLSENIDQAISLLETHNVESIPVEKFALVIPNQLADNPDVQQFAEWILAQGQQYNHQFGFLTLDEQTLNAQRALNAQRTALRTK